MTLASKRNNETNPKELGDYPNYMFLYYNLLLAPGIIGILFLFLVFHQNTGLRKTFFDSVKDTFQNIKEKLQI
jgi:hypothetical protein